MYVCQSLNDLRTQNVQTPVNHYVVVFTPKGVSIHAAPVTINATTAWLLHRL